MIKLVECVPNFSEGRDEKIIEKISNAITSVDGVDLLDVDPGAETNRTVVTIVGAPDNVVEAAFRAIEAASKLIDMSKHQGAHARMAATDVCPFVPVSGMTMDDCVALAKRLGERVGSELNIPVYLYEEAAASPERQNLANVRQGEYEGLEKKLAMPEWAPDFGPARFNARSGATVIGARKFLIAYNVNVNSRSRRLAHNIALDIRERGRFQRDANKKFVRDENGEKVRKPGLLKACKAVGWVIPEYDRAQISINLTDFEETPPHRAFDACEERAGKYGLRVTGSELVGLIPLDAMILAGKHYLKKQNLSCGIPERMIVQTAIQSLGLNEITPFIPDEKIIEYRIAKKDKQNLVSMTCTEFTDELSSDSPAPGGGSVAALCGALGAGLAGMVANLTDEKKGYEDSKAFMSEIAEKGQTLKDAFLADVDRDTDAFNHLMACMGLPKSTKKDAAARTDAIRQATIDVTMIPFGVLERSLAVVELAKAMAEKGNPNSISDAGVGICSAQTAGMGAFLNVFINLADLDDPDLVEEIKNKALALRDALLKNSEEALDIVFKALNIPQ